MRRLAIAIALLAAGCTSEPERIELRDCEAVLAHLTVLEQRDWGKDGPLCKYHPSCQGSEHRSFLEHCPKVLAEAELRCYQKATTLTEADSCLRRAELDERIQSAASGSASYGDEPAPWLGRTGAGGEEHRLGSLTSLRERACACKDPRCAADATDQLDAWKRRNGEPASKREIELDLQIGYCVRSASTMSPDAGSIYLGYPDAGSYYDPYSSATGIPECDQLVTEYEKFMNCSAIPQDSRNAIRDSIQQMKDMYKQMATNDRQSAIDLCKQQIDGIKSALAASGC